MGTSEWGKKRTVHQRFWEKVDKSPGQGPNGECWVWKAGKYGNRTGTPGQFYGVFRFRDETWLAHRVAYILTFGEIPEGKNVLHVCDFPPCVRPDHLFSGTHLENIQDCVAKGRHKKPPGNFSVGSARHNSKLTENQVLEIRALAQRGTPFGMLAKMYNTHRVNIGVIVHRGSWRHI